METEQALIAFAAKVDEFAATLTPAEQSMLAELITDQDDDVSGFGSNTGWPGLTTLTPLKLGTTDDFQSGGGGSPKVFRTEPTTDGFMSSGSADPTI